MRKDIETLIAAIDEIGRIFDSEADWEMKFDVIFGYWSNYVGGREILKRLSIWFEYYDPDTSYEEDVTAFVCALRELRQRLAELLPAPVEATA